MPIRTNAHGQPIGTAVPDWPGAAMPTPVTMVGRYVRVEPLTSGHVADLFECTCADHQDREWTYLTEDRPPDLATLRSQVTAWMADPNSIPFTLVPLATGRAAGRASYLRIDPLNGSLEIGSIHLGVGLARTRAGTEAMYLLARHAFEDLGYRRYEWKCDSLNAPSRAAATRLGFTHEGRFRQAVVYAGRNRDTDWFSIIDTEWPALRAAYEAWLDPANFDDDGRQQRSLSSFVVGGP
jgi:RimJ/RimL family protein N-acetyltransferase